MKIATRPASPSAGSVCVPDAADGCGDGCDVCDAPAHATPRCDLGACTFACDDGYERCGDACVATTTDAAHCGGCGNACGADQTAGVVRADSGKSVATLADGSVVVTGDFRDTAVFGSGEENETTLSARDNDFFLTRFAP